jgi:uncharacterized protein YbjT (DUF2867 family)
VSATYAVVGATGATGGAVATALRDSGSQVRAIARNPNSTRARNLSQEGIGVVAADLDDVDALTLAFSGVAGVFAITTPFEEGPDAEVEQGLHMIAAAAQARVPHLVFSSVANADRHTGIPHFDSKAKVEAALADSGVPHTILGPTYFYDNMLGGVDELQSGIFSLPIPASTPLQQLSRRDFGRFAATALHNPERFLGARIDVASDAPTPRQMAATIQQALSRPIELVTTDPTKIGSPDMRAMFTYLTDHGYSADIDNLRQSYPQIGWQSFEGWVDENLRA